MSAHPAENETIAATFSLKRERGIIAMALSIFFATFANAQSIETKVFKAEVDAFFDREVPAHLSQIPEAGPLPDKVYGAITTGEFSWGTYVRSLAAYAETRKTRTVGGRDIVPLVGRVGVSESAKGSKAFAQLYAALALRHFGRDLETNPLWRSLSESDRTAWRSLLDPTRFYNPATRQVINLPENYLGVAARVATLSFQMGVLRDRAFIDSLLDRAAEPFTKGALYADDAGTTGRYDRYSNEYARYVYEAAETVGREDILDALKPTLTTQMKLWWDLVSPDGYGYQWGRSLGVVSYLDTLEIVAFLGLHPEFRPAPIADLASEYRLAWRWLDDDYRDDAHMLSVFAPGRSNYAYISKDREWQQTVGFLGKAVMAHDTLMRALAAEKVDTFPSTPAYPKVARFEFFRKGDRPAGVWLVRQGPVRFALPFTTGTRPGYSDYLPAPHGLPGFAVPVEQAIPAGASYYDLADGRTVVATEGADEIAPDPDGFGVTATWRRFVAKGGKTNDWTEPGFTITMKWRLEGSKLRRTETLTATRDVTIAKLSFLFPTTAVRPPIFTMSFPPGVRVTSREASLGITTAGDLKVNTSGSIHSPETPLGRSARGAIEHHIHFDATGIVLKAGEKRSWELIVDVAPPAN
jgi:hypothetical protein